MGLYRISECHPSDECVLRAVRCKSWQDDNLTDDNLTGKDPLGGSAFAKEASVRRNNYDECHDHYR